MTTTKVIEIIGESRNSWTEAVENAIAEACQTIDGITGVDVVNLKGTIENGKIVEYKANVQLAFPVERRGVRSGREL